MNKMRFYRRLNNISQEELAKILNVSRSQISNIEKGLSELNESKIKTLCELFKITADELLGIEKGEK